MSDLNLLQKKLNIQFHDINLLKQSLTHSSYLNENSNHEIKDNERLEFLGDAVLNFITAEILFSRFPIIKEGELTSLRTLLTRRQTLAKLAEKLNLGKHLLMSRGEEMSGGRNKVKNMANAFEALIGAIFLDHGINTVEKFITDLLEPFLHEIEIGNISINYKSKLQEFSQIKYQQLPDYRVINVTGPDHDKRFTVAVFINNEEIGNGSGRNKKLAEMEAAKAACNKLKI